MILIAVPAALQKTRTDGRHVALTLNPDHCACQRQARSQSEVPGRGNPVLPKHQVLVRPAPAPGTGYGASPAESGQAGLAGAELQHGVPAPEELAGRAQLPAEQIAVAVAASSSWAKVNANARSMAPNIGVNGARSIWASTPRRWRYAPSR